MKKILLISFFIVAGSMHLSAQNHKNAAGHTNFNTNKTDDPGKRIQVRKFKTPIVLTDTLVGFSAIASDNDTNQVIISYQVLDQAGRTLKNGIYKCSGICYSRYNAQYSKNIVHQIIADSVFKVSIIPK